MDSNPVVALIIALGRALPRLLRPARSAANLMVGAAGDLTRTRSALMEETPCCVSSSSYFVATSSGLGFAAATAYSYSSWPD